MESVPLKQTSLVGGNAYTQTSAWDKVQPFDVTATKSLFLFAYNNPIRRRFRHIVEDRKFDFFILIVIMGNCVSLAAYQPLPNLDTTLINDKIDDAELFFVIIFVIEMILKIVAWGLYYCGPGSYLRNGWNVLDFIIVIVALTDQIFSDQLGEATALQALRGFRVLRPLKFVTSIQSLQSVMISLIKSIPRLSHVAGLVLFLLVIATIIGVEFYRGFDTSDSPREGIVSFENAGKSFLTMFVVVTLEGWTDTFYWVESVKPNWANWIFFIFLVVMGAFVALDLALGVLSGQFTQQGAILERKQQSKKRMTARRRKRAHRQYNEWMESGVKMTALADDLDNTRIENYDEENDEKTESITAPEARQEEDVNIDGIDLLTKSECGHDLQTLLQEHLKEGRKVLAEERLIDMQDDDADDLDEEVADDSTPMIMVRDINGTVHKIDVGEEDNWDILQLRRAISMNPYIIVPPNEAYYFMQPNGEIASNKAFLNDLNLLFRGDREVAELEGSSNARKTAAAVLLKESTLTVLTRAGAIAKSKTFTICVLCIVFLSSGALAFSTYPQSHSKELVLVILDVAFSIIYVLEAAFKIYALGRKSYFGSAFNRLDFIVTLLGIIDLIIFAATGSGYGLSVVRSFRLIRVFRYTTYWESMRDFGTALVDGIWAILSLVLLLGIFIFIAALLGMQLFGGRFSTAAGQSRSNFDDFGTAFLAIFQVLTGEDWNIIMYDAIDSYNGLTKFGGALAALFFLLVFILGNFILLNVFLAIAVKGLEDSREARDVREQHEARWHNTEIEGTIAKQQIDVFVSHFRSFDTFGRESAARVAAIEKLLKRWGYKTFNSDRFLGIGGTTSQIHQLMYTKVKSSCVFVAVLSEDYVLGVDDNIYVQPHHAVQYNSAVENLGANQIIPITLDPEMTKKKNWTHKFTEPLGKTKVFDFSTNNDDTDAELQVDSDIIVQLCQTIDSKLSGEDKKLENPEEEKAEAKREILKFSSLYFFPPLDKAPTSSPVQAVLFKFRSKLYDFIMHPYFDQFILLIILLSSVALALEDPTDEEASINKRLAVADYVFTGLFCWEMVMKVVVLSLWNHPNAYLREPWNRLDAFCVISAVLSLAFPTISVFKSLRTVRVLRPLRAIKRAPGLQVVVECLMFSIGAIFNVTVMTFLLMFMFAVIGVHVLKGKFFSCNDLTIRYEDECVGVYSYYPDNNFAEPPLVATREWSQPFFNFDNVGKALLALLASSTTEGWVTFLHNAEDGTEKGVGPIERYNRSIDIYFILFMVVVTFFMLNIFVGYVIVVFAEQGERKYVGIGLSKNQRNCVEYALSSKPELKFQAVYRFQHMMYQFVGTKSFDVVVLLAIFFNSITLLMQYDSMSDEYTEALSNANLVFLVFFILEAVFKLLAYNPTTYFGDSWNCLDFLIVVGSIADISMGSSGVSVGFLRLFRVARILKLVNKGDEMRQLLTTFIKSFRSLPYVILLIALVFFIFAVVGMGFFGDIEPSEDQETLDHNNNFRTFGKALMILFRSVTGEGWQNILAECYEAPEGGLVAIPYFVLFTVLVTFLIINLFVAVIMDNFEYLTQDPSTLGVHHLQKFSRMWQTLDPAASGKVRAGSLIALFKAQDPPLGFGKCCPDRLARLHIMRMNPGLDQDGLATYNSVLLSIVRYRLDIKMDPARGWDTQNSELATIIKKVWPWACKRQNGVSLLDYVAPPPSDRNFAQTAGQLYAIRLCQEYARRHLKAIRPSPSPENYFVGENLEEENQESYI
eukprot:m.27120 g.27120  ORF g.27120 m.27120 type:complete len:1754 (-) comp7865_c0_seq1:131-5392(-)